MRWKQPDRKRKFALFPAKLLGGKVVWLEWYAVRRSMEGDYIDHPLFREEIRPEKS